MSQSAHRVSVIIPICNVEHYLWQCLVSIQSGLGRALQVIIVDDGSTDRSHEVAERFLEVQPTHANTPEYELVSKPNGGYGSAMNAGLELADGEYVGILEADDYLKGDLFGELSRIARACGDPDIVKSTYWRVMEPDTPEQRTYHSLLRHRGVPTWEEGTIDLGRAPQLVRYHPSIWSAIYRRDFLDATGTRFVEAPGGGWVDNPFMMRTMCQAERIAYTDDAWYCYREDRPGSSSVLKAPEVPLERWQEMAHEVKLSRWADDEGVLGVLYTIAFQHLSRLWGTPTYEGVEDLAEGIMRSMRPEIVLGLAEVPPAAKERYLEATGREPRRIGAGPYCRHLVLEAVHSVREDGPGYAIARVRGARADREAQ